MDGLVPIEKFLDSLAELNLDPDLVAYANAADATARRALIGAKLPDALIRSTAQGAPPDGTVAIYIGQPCRVGDSAPYTWYKSYALDKWELDATSASSVQLSVTPPVITGGLWYDSEEGILSIWDPANNVWVSLSMISTGDSDVFVDAD
jgi:hypothetical protein